MNELSEKLELSNHEQGVLAETIERYEKGVKLALDQLEYNNPRTPMPGGMIQMKHHSLIMAVINLHKTLDPLWEPPDGDAPH